MDDDDLRRGRPATHRAFGEATAILAGDALQALAFEILADPATNSIAEVRAVLCAGLARAIGLAGMVGGQMLDLDAEGATAPLSVKEIARLQAMKTGALLRLASRRGRGSAGRAPRRARRSGLMGGRSGRRFRSPTTFSTPRATPPRSASAPRRTPGATRPRSSARSASRVAAASSPALSTRRHRRSSAASLGAAGDVLRATARFVAARKKSSAARRHRPAGVSSSAPTA